MTNEEIIIELAKFLRDETIEECPITITSRENIEGEDAELVRFTFGNANDSCICIVYSDGTIFTPTDWQTPVWDNDYYWEIEDSTWMDCRFVEAIIFNGMPRMFA